MQLIKIIEARAALSRLSGTRFKNFSVARNLCALCKRVEDEVEFFSGEQQKLVQAYALLENGKPVSSGNGMIRLKDGAAQEVYNAEMERLMKTEIDDFSPVVVTEADFRSEEDYPTPDDMMALDGLVEFKE